MPRSRTPLATDLRRAAARFHVWRRTRRKRVIAADLWHLACEMARRHGVAAAARALGLDYSGLKRRLGRRGAGPRTFVEVVPAPVARTCAVEIEDGRGGTMRLRIEEADAVALADVLGRAFWGRPR